MNTLPQFTHHQRVVIIGAGGHGKVVISTLQDSGFEVVACYDDDSSLHGSRVLNVPVVGKVDQIANIPNCHAVIAIGSNHVRKMIAGRFPHVTWITAVHPHSFIHYSVKLGPGTVVFAGAVIQPETEVGDHAIVNTGAMIDHDCRIGHFAHIAPRVALAGGVQINEGTFIGIGSSIIPFIKVGAWTVIGAGSVVVREIPDSVTAYGVPAKIRS